MVPCSKCAPPTAPPPADAVAGGPARPIGSREGTEKVPLYRYNRYSNPILPQPGRGGDWGPVLEALERQNALLTDLLGAINGLTAAFLCQKGESRDSGQF